MSLFCQENSSESIILDEDDRCELSLINSEILGCFIIILGYLLLMFSAFKDRRDICTPNTDYDQYSCTNSSQTALAAFVIIIIGMFILAQVAFARFNINWTESCRQENQQSISPSANLFLGYLITIFGYTFKVLGAGQESIEKSQVTIV